jgi:hypothetical protein
MTVRELISELSQVESVIRIARTPDPISPSPGGGPVAGDGWEDLAVLAVRERQIVRELRRRREPRRL